MTLELNVAILARYCTQSVKSGPLCVSSASVQCGQSHIDGDGCYPYDLHVLVDHYYLWLTIHYSEAFVQKPLVNIFVLDENLTEPSSVLTLFVFGCLDRDCLSQDPLAESIP